jgi:hypothetical protein
MKTLCFDIELRRMATLPRLLLLTTRLGGEVRSIHAADGKLELTIDAPEVAAHRFGPQLERIIDVVSLQQRDSE